MQRKFGLLHERPFVKFPCRINVLSAYLIPEEYTLHFVILLSNFGRKIVSSNKMPISTDN